MKPNLKLIASVAIMISSMSANAELLTRDYLAKGDNDVVIDDESGLEWLSESYTTGKTYDEVQGMLQGSLSGWRMPTYQEVTSLIMGQMPFIKEDMFTSSAVIQDDYRRNKDKMSQFNALFSGGSHKTNYIWLINEEGNEKSHLRFETLDVKRDDYSFHSYGEYGMDLNKSYSHMGYFLVRDGGSDVPVSGMFLGGVALMGLALRRKKTTASQNK